MADPKKKYQSALICALLLAAAVTAYWPVFRCGFVNFDDPEYVTGNPMVKQGFSQDALLWAATTYHTGYWHPMTWISLILDFRLFGSNPTGFHATSLLLHCANSLLLFVLLRRMTSATWRSAFVAALFALHPLHVESVAWIAERKDVLCGFFCLLTIWAYARYAEGRRKNAESSSTPHLSRFTLHASRFYLLSLFFFALALLSKPMAVTLPCVLLLLDYWPLNRFPQAKTPPCSASFVLHPSSFILFEKLPFLALSIGSSIVTVIGQKAVGTLAGAATIPISSRLGTAAFGYLGYLKKMIWPIDLAVFYPLVHWEAWETLVGWLFLAALSILILRWAFRRPYLAIGWLWFVGTLVPVIGLVQVGKQALGDRYAYLPSIGLSIMLAWGACDLLQHWRWRRFALTVVATVVLVLCLAQTRRQIGYWRDGESLFRRALTVTGDNDLAQNNLGSALLEKGQVDEAIIHLQAAIKADPSYAIAHSNLGAALVKQGRLDEAICCLREALRLKPELAQAQCNLGIALERQGHLDDAVGHLNEALRLAPRDAHPHYNLGTALLKKGEVGEAIRQFQAALELEPDYSEAHRDLGMALGGQGRLDEAVSHLRKALTLAPEDAEAHCGLGVTLGRQGRLDEAIGQFEEALKLNPNQAEAHCGLGAALSRAMRLDKAIEHLNEALRLNPAYAEAHCNLGVALGKQGCLDDAISHLREAVRLKPSYAEAQNNLRTALNLKAGAPAPDTAPPR